MPVENRLPFKLQKRREIEKETVLIKRKFFYKRAQRKNELIL